MDAFVAGLVESIHGDGQLGETWTVVIADQFRRMRDGDRFFYMRSGTHPKKVKDPSIISMGAMGMVYISHSYTMCAGANA